VTRILWLRGLEAQKRQRVFSRYLYSWHAGGRLIGKPASYGCHPDALGRHHQLYDIVEPAPRSYIVNAPLAASSQSGVGSFEAFRSTVPPACHEYKYREKRVDVLCLQSAQQRMRVTIGSRPGESGATISPVRRRSLNTAPDGALSPIFWAICSLPSGVKRLPRQSPNPNLEVETG